MTELRPFLLLSPLHFVQAQLFYLAESRENTSSGRSFFAARFSIVAATLTLMSIGAFTQPQWTVPVRITSTNNNELHPTISDGHGWLSYQQEELLAFSRNGKDICILQTTSSGASWSDSIFCLTHDLADNDYPSLMRTYNGSGMLVWQGRRHGNLEILFSRLRGGMWSSPIPITTNSVADQFPHVSTSLNDSSFYAVWVQEGKVMFSGYSSNAWTIPEIVSPAGDTLNYLPQVTSWYQSGNYMPIVVWQRRNTGDSSHSIVSSRRIASLWTAPDTLVATGDNRRPRFYKYASGFLTWDHSDATGSITEGGFLSLTGGKVRVSGIAQIGGPAQNQRNASVNGVMIITEWPGSPTFLPHGAATWESTTLDSIGVSRGIYGGPFDEAKLSPAGATGNRNPTISQGTYVIGGGFRMRFWSVWESNVGNKWQLFGSNTTITVGDVERGTNKPNAVWLAQNYPNPFNPATNIEFRIANREFVSLKAFDLLGREVATLVDDVKEAGVHSAQFYAGNLSSGVYFYQLKSGRFVQTRKLVLMK